MVSEAYCKPGPRFLSKLRAAKHAKKYFEWEESTSELEEETLKQKRLDKEKRGEINDAVTTDSKGHLVVCKSDHGDWQAAHGDLGSHTCSLHLV